MARAIAMVDAARAEGLDVSANMYAYTAGATGLTAALPPWVQAGGHDAMVARLKDPAIRARVLAAGRDPDGEWESAEERRVGKGWVRSGGAGCAKDRKKKTKQ